MVIRRRIAGVRTPARRSIEIPYDPPEEYDYRIVFVPTHDNEGVEQICRGGGRQFRFYRRGMAQHHRGFPSDQRKFADDNATTTKAGHWIVAGQRHV